MSRRSLLVAVCVAWIATPVAAQSHDKEVTQPAPATHENSPAKTSLSPNLSMKEVKVAVARLRQKIAEVAVETPPGSSTAPQVRKGSGSAPKREELAGRVRLSWRTTLAWPSASSNDGQPAEQSTDRVTLRWPQ
jgi:hypothetical protein